MSLSKTVLKLLTFIFCLTLLITFCGCATKTDAPSTESSPAENNAQSNIKNEDKLTVDSGYQSEAVQASKGIVPTCVRMRNSNLYVYSFDEQNDNAAIIYQSDLDGNILHTYSVSFEEFGFITDFYPDSTGLWVMTNLYADGDIENYDITMLLHFADELDIMDSSLDFQFAVDSLESMPLSMVFDNNHKALYLFGTGYLAAFDTDGAGLFTIEADGYLYHACFTKDGLLAVCDTSSGQARIRLLDFDNQTWHDGVSLDISYRKMFGGFDYDLYVSDGKTLYGVDLETGENTAILQWLDTGVGTGSDTFECFSLGNNTYLVATDSGLFRLFPADTENTRTVLTMATFEYEIAAQAALKFNGAQSEYKIIVKDYSNYNTQMGGAEGLNRLNLDIASGDAPDIYDLTSLPISQYVKKGVLEDIYPYLDADPELTRKDFSEELLSAMEYDGKLYCLIPHSCILTLLANPSDMDDITEWNFEAMLQLADGKDPFGGELARRDFIQIMLAGNDSPFVDWVNGNCSFDSEEFVNLLEFAKLLPEKTVAEYREEGADIESNDEPCELVYSLTSEFGSFVYASLTLDCFDGGNRCASAVGLPGSGSPRYLLYPTRLSWGMSALSENKDGVWQFMRSFLSEEYQSENMIPLLTSAWENTTNEYEQWLASGGSFYTVARGQEYDISITSDVYFEALTTLKDSATGVYEENPALMEIIWSEAQGYFAGDKTAEKAAQNIQSRVSIYMAEQG